MGQVTTASLIRPVWSASVSTRCVANGSAAAAAEVRVEKASQCVEEVTSSTRRVSGAAPSLRTVSPARTEIAAEAGVRCTSRS